MRVWGLSHSADTESLEVSEPKGHSVEGVEKARLSFRGRFWIPRQLPLHHSPGKGWWSPYQGGTAPPCPRPGWDQECQLKVSGPGGHPGETRQ